MLSVHRKEAPRLAMRPSSPQAEKRRQQTHHLCEQSSTGPAAGALGSADALRASQQSTGGVAQAADASLAQASQQSSTGSVAGTPDSANALCASQGSAQADRVSQQPTGGVAQQMHHLLESHSRAAQVSWLEPQARRMLSVHCKEVPRLAMCPSRLQEWRKQQTHHLLEPRSRAAEAL